MRMNGKEMPFLTHSYPRAVIHMDADAFFASVEQAVNPGLRGRPVVTGKERGIIACASYEAKALGVKRGISLRDARRMCPGLVVLPSDYETYSLFSMRMFSILGRFTPSVEAYSIDEAFADLGGLRRVFRCPYREIAGRIKRAVREELGITVSIGLSVSKSLAKLASDREKPDGLTEVDGTVIQDFLRGIPAGDVWGIGPNGAALLGKHGIVTALDFARSNERWVSSLLGKNGREIWNELRGNAVWEVAAGDRGPRASISKARTFPAPSSDRDYVYARLVRSIESAFIKLRRHGLRAGALGIMLRRADYRESGLKCDLDRPAVSAQEIMPLAGLLFERLFQAGTVYRSTAAFLWKLEEQGPAQMELFEDNERTAKLARIAEIADGLGGRYGKHKVSLAASLFLQNEPEGPRTELPARKRTLLPGETSRKRIGIPMMSVKV